jgi:hypothetical protein
MFICQYISSNSSWRTHMTHYVAPRTRCDHRQTDFARLAANWLHVQLLIWGLSFASTPSAYLFADGPRGLSVRIATVTLLPGSLTTLLPRQKFTLRAS